MSTLAYTIVVSLISLIATFFIWLIYLIHNQREKYANIPGPKTSGILDFFLGDGRRMYEWKDNQIPLSEQITRSFKEFKSKTIKHRLLNFTFILTQDAKLIKTILSDLDCPRAGWLNRRFGYPFGVRYSGDGLLGDIDSQKWKRERSMFNAAFHKQALKSFMKEFNSKGDVLMRHLKAIAESKNNEVSLLDKFKSTTLDVIASAAFSMDLDSVNNPNNNLNSAVLKALLGVQKFILDPLFILNPSNFSEIVKNRQTFKSIREIGRIEIAKRMEAMKNGELTPDDILTIMFQMQEKEKDFPIEDMLDHFVTFFIAGLESTANALAFVFLEICKNPEILRKLREEIDREIGAKSSIDYDDLSKLNYTSCVFKEALRLHPPVGEIVRVTNQDIALDDSTTIIPKGSAIALSIYASSRDEEYFPDALSFKPERFAAEKLNNIQNFAYFPFSLGPRNCIGQNFARMEAKVMIAKFIQNFNFQLDPTQSFEKLQAVTLRPKDGTRGFITIRN